MSEYPFGSAPRRPRPGAGRVCPGRVALFALGAVFVLGVALGKALNDSPRTGKMVTYVRTLEPLPQQPVGSP